MRRNSLLPIIALLLAAVLFSGCPMRPAGVGEADDFAAQTYKALKSAKIFYEEGLSAAADAHRLGVIDDAQKDDAIAAGDAFAAAWQAAAGMLYRYAAGLSDQASVEEKLELFQAAYLKFSALCRPLLIKALTEGGV